MVYVSQMNKALIIMVILVTLVTLNQIAFSEAGNLRRHLITHSGKSQINAASVTMHALRQVILTLI